MRQMSEKLHHLIGSLHTGYVDKELPSYRPLWPGLIINDKTQGKKVLSTLLYELNNCEEFWISVAFVTTSGVAVLIETLNELELIGIKGKILVSQYLNFTHPEALKRLLKFTNIELKIAVEGNFHSKGYLFKRGQIYNLIVGSSNLTSSALSSNTEWNLKVSATAESYLIHNTLLEFKVQFDKAIAVSDEYIAQYTELYQKELKYSKLLKRGLNEQVHKEIIPNEMQTKALQRIEALRMEGKSKALLISATGTGKTFLSAFDVKKFNPRRFLFIVHRLNIAETALRAYQKIFEPGKPMGIYSSEVKNTAADFIFSTVQTLSKQENLEQFAPDCFDYIVIDESHRSGAGSYQRILNYFKPSFLLGMTATPERTDGADIFRLFDYNIAYEIRLHQALEVDILSPFHYYGVTDITVNDDLLDENADFNALTSNERIERIIEKAHLYGTDSGSIKGLIFCSSVKEAKALSDGLNKHGLKTKALSGDDSEELRARTIDELEADGLDYILTVDIFNEGIDIPSVNQIIMLRPTQSAIVFVQQLGRGLRKVEGKDYLTVIDFIGNYKNNFLVPIALYGDSSYNKDTLRNLMVSGSSLIPGTSTINFDLVSRNKIFEAINKANMQLSRDLRKDYDLLKYRIGQIPMMMDFVLHGSRDPQLYSDYAKSYFNYVASIENGLEHQLNSDHIKLLELFAKEINNAKRVEESLILQAIIDKGQISKSQLKDAIHEKYGYELDDSTWESCLTNLNFKFVTESKSGKLISANEIYGFSLFECLHDTIQPTDFFQSCLRQTDFSRFLLDNTLYAIHVFEKGFDPIKYSKGFVRYRKYSRKDVFRVLNWPSNPLAQNVGGYMISTDKSSCPIFVNYHKAEEISNSTKYEDGFIDPHLFEWMSKSKRKLTSPDVVAIRNYRSGLRLPLFIKKNNDEGTEFYYIGELTPIDDSFEQTTIKNDKGGQDSIVKVRFHLDQPVEEKLYHYLTTNIDAQFSKSKITSKYLELPDELDANSLAAE